MFSNRRRNWQAETMHCQKCQTELTALRGCREVSLRCPECGATYDLKDYYQEIDDSFEEEMGFVPMDRV